jgi:hypothetical protein
VPNQDTYKKAVKISEEYLGPAGERFIRRQIITHLHIEPEDLKDSQLNELAEWLHGAFAVITKDINYVNEYVNRILSLSSENITQPAGMKHDRVS